MEGFFAGVGAVVLTSRTIFWVCALSYLVFTAWASYAAFFAPREDFPVTESDCTDFA